MICDSSPVLNWGSDIVIMQLMPSISPARRKFFDVSELNFFFHQKSEAKFQASLEAQKKTKIKRAK